MSKWLTLSITLNYLLSFWLYKHLSEKASFKDIFKALAPYNHFYWIISSAASLHTRIWTDKFPWLPPKQQHISPDQKMGCSQMLGRCGITPLLRLWAWLLINWSFSLIYSSKYFIHNIQASANQLLDKTIWESNRAERFLHHKKGECLWIPLIILNT